MSENKENTGQTSAQRGNTRQASAGGAPDAGQVKARAGQEIRNGSGAGQARAARTGAKQSGARDTKGGQTNGNRAGEDSQGWNANRAKQKVTALAEALAGGRVEQVETEWKAFDHRPIQEQQSVLKDLWGLAIKTSLPLESQQWLAKRMPLIECLPAIPNVISAYVRMVTRSNYFQRLGVKNLNLLVELSQSAGFEDHWYALVGSVGSRADDEQDREARLALWEQLYLAHQARHQRRAWVPLTNLLERAVRAGNRTATGWLVKTNHQRMIQYRSRDESKGEDVYNHQDDTDFLLSGLDNIGPGELTGTHLATVLADIPKEWIDWGRVITRDYLGLSAELREARQLLIKEEMERNVTPAEPERTSPTPRI